MRWLPAVLVAFGCAPSDDWQAMTVIHGVPYVEVSVDGAVRTCLLDTGLTDDLALRSTLAPAGEVELDFGRGRDDVDPTTDPANDALLDRLGGGELQVDCVLGWDALRNHALTLDYAADRWRVGRSRSGSFEIDDAELGEPLHAAFDRTDRWAELPLGLGDAEVMAAVDTGATYVHLEPAAFALLDPPPETSPIDVNAVDGVFRAATGILETAQVGAAIRHEVPFSTYASAQLTDDDAPEAIVGASFLAGYAVTVDRDREGLTLQPYPEDVQAELAAQLLE